MARSARLVRITPPRGPPSVLCVVVVTTSACGTGLGCSPAATRPAKCAMSTMRQGADLVGDPAKLGEVQVERVRRPARDDQLRLVLEGQSLDLGHVDPEVGLANVVRHDVVQLPAVVRAACRGSGGRRGRGRVRGSCRRGRAGRTWSPRWPARRSGAARSRSRRRTAPSRGRSPAARRRRCARSRRSSDDRGSPRRTCWSAPNPGPPSRLRARSSRSRSARECPAGERARPDGGVNLRVAVGETLVEGGHLTHHRSGPGRQRPPAGPESP